MFGIYHGKVLESAELQCFPVVLNGVNMTNFAPPYSYIDIKDFDNDIEGKLIWKIGRVNKFNLTLNHAAN